MTATSPSRQSSLEVLRIFGILMIVMMHFSSQGGIPTSGNLPITLLTSSGRIAVMQNVTRGEYTARYVLQKATPWTVN